MSPAKKTAATVDVAVALPRIESRITVVRGHKVLIDADLADLYGVPTKAQLKQVFDALRELMTPPDPPKRPIGFVAPQEKK